MIKHLTFLFEELSNFKFGTSEWDWEQNRKEISEILSQNISTKVSPPDIELNL